MSDISRSFKDVILARIQEKSPLIQVLVGPRQVGKTTAIRQIFRDQGLYFSADSPTPLNASEIEVLWEKALHLKTPLLAIDEIQKISGWSEIIKKLWDNKKIKMKLILLGSAALAIEKDLKESLAGRYELIRVEHWNLSEAQAAFNMSFDHYLEYGCYPGSNTFLNDTERWASYIRDSIIEPAIGRDILQLHPVQNPALLRQVFSVCVGHPAQIISLNKIQGVLQDRGAIATLQTYLELLGYGFLVTGLQKFSNKVIRSKSSPPKLIVHDNALLRAFERPVLKKPSAERMGHYLENAIGARFIEAGWETYYWKDKQNEVDFVVLGPNGEKWAVEVKSSPPSEKELSGLFYFCKNQPEFEPVLICPEKVDSQKVMYKSAADILSMSRHG